MKVTGKIGDIQVTFQQEKKREDGSKYWGERYQIAFEVGDDIHLVDTKIIYCQNKGGGIERLRKNNIFVGAWGEMRINYSFRLWSDKNTGKEKRIREVEMIEFKNLLPSQKDKEPKTVEEPTPTLIEPAKPEEIEAVMAKAAAKAAAQQSPDDSTDLPF